MMLNWQRTWRTDSITRWYRERIRKQLSKIFELSLNWTWMKVLSPSSYWPDRTRLMPLCELNWTQIPVYCWQPSKTEWSCAKHGLNRRACFNCGEATHIFRSLLSCFDILMLNSLVRIIILIKKSCEILWLGTSVWGIGIVGGGLKTHVNMIMIGGERNLVYFLWLLNKLQTLYVYRS